MKEERVNLDSLASRFKILAIVRQIIFFGIDFLLIYANCFFFDKLFVHNCSPKEDLCVLFNMTGGMIVTGIIFIHTIPQLVSLCKDIKNF